MYKRKIGIVKSLMITYYWPFEVAKDMYKTILLYKSYDEFVWKWKNEWYHVVKKYLIIAMKRKYGE